MGNRIAIFIIIIFSLFCGSCSDFLIDSKIDPYNSSVFDEMIISIDSGNVITGLSPYLSFSMGNMIPDSLYEIRIQSLSGGDAIEMAGQVPQTGFIEKHDLDISSLPDGLFYIEARCQDYEQNWKTWSESDHCILDRQVSDYYNQLQFSDFSGGNLSDSNISENLSLFYDAGGGMTLSWDSSDRSIIDPGGNVSPPEYGENDLIEFKAILSNGISTLTKSFDLRVPFVDYDSYNDTVPPLYTDATAEGVDNSGVDPDVGTELQNAIYSADAAGEDLFLPSGIYPIGREIDPVDNFILQGSAEGATIINSTDSSRLIHLQAGDPVDTVSNLTIRNMVFIDTGLYFDNLADGFSNVLIENCIFINNDYSPADGKSLVFASDMTNITIRNSFFLIKESLSNVELMNTFKNNSMTIENNVFGFDDSSIPFIKSVANSEILSLLPKVQWLENQGYYSADMRGLDDRYIKLQHDNYGLSVNNRVYGNLFFGKPGNTALLLLNISGVEVGGNYFENFDTIDTGVNVVNSSQIVMAENHFFRTPLSLNINDRDTDQMDDIYIAGNRFDGSHLTFKDEETAATSATSIYFAGNRFVRGDERIVLIQSNDSALYDASCFWIDRSNSYLSSQPVIVDDSLIAGSSTSFSGDLEPSDGASSFYHPSNYSLPLP